MANEGINLGRSVGRLIISDIRLKTLYEVKVVHHPTERTTKALRAIATTVSVFP